MADNQQSNRQATTNTFSKGMLKDYNDTFVGEGLYTHARNAVNNSHDGQIGVIGNEPSNIKCIDLPYTLIGAIHLYEDKWAIFTTDDVNSEIGVFDESMCSYETKVNSTCLGFKKTNLITGAFRRRYDCEDVIYWDDGLNPSRTMNLNNLQEYYKYTDKVVNGCIQRTYTDEFDCEKIRLSFLFNHPCLKLKKGSIGGTLPNGSYQACIAYTINQVRVTDYIGLTEVQSLFTYQNGGSSLEVEIVDIDDRFDEFELVIVSNINQQTTAKKIGNYSTVTGKIFIDRWSNDYTTVPLSSIVLRSESIDKSEAMYSVNNYLLRVGTYSKFKFNYQPQANNIITKWVAVQYPAEYYARGGNNAGYMRDEQYAFFIRWIYNTGERSESYHIPGRVGESDELDNVFDKDAFETKDGVEVKRWQIENTGSITELVNLPSGDGGTIIAKGKMGYWESTELYPADNSIVWGNLCGKPIRHHKFPDITVDPILNHFNSLGNGIVTLGVQFEGITHPLDLDGNPIESIVGYEILRGSREGNKSIIGKGILNNMREYVVPGNSEIKGLYQNYPYNDLRPDSYLTSEEQTGENGKKKVNSGKLSKYTQDVFSFHSPEFSFSNPYLNASELKIYQELNGVSRGRFEIPWQHPKFKQLDDTLDAALDLFSTAVATIQSASAVIGGYSVTLAAKKDLPPVELGVKNIAGGIGPAGSFSAILQAAGAIANGIIQAAYLVLFGARVTKSQILAMVYGLIPNRQFALQYVSHAFYNTSIPSVAGERRRKITDSNYVNPGIQQFTKDYQVNNLNRAKYVILKLDDVVQNPTVTDNSRFILSESGKDKYQTITSTVSSHYGALKIAIATQYGQLESIKQLPISDCIHPSLPILKKKTTSPVLFGGDIYINRFTEKNSMLFFNTWLRGEPDGYEFDYSFYMNIPYPRFWINNVSDIGLFSDKPSQYRSLDKVSKNWFFVQKGSFYLFNSGVRDFFVESEINLAQRDWEDEPSKRHYDFNTYTDLTSMFRSDIVAGGNFYKYDYSLSVSKLFNSQITWGQLLPRDYDPQLYSTCYIYRPFRLIYSIPQQFESKKDNWRVFLANNYTEFNSRLTAVKSINKTGALFLMKNESPLSFMGVEELKLDGSNTKVTIGDGGLFESGRQLQSIINVDFTYEYGSSQSRYASINTAYGVFWVSQEQGKVFQYAGQLKEVSSNGMKWWFAKYLPSQLLKQYPDYPLFDNPIKGVGVQMVFDNVNEIIYITKKDYKPKFSDMTFDQEGNFYSKKGTKVDFTNPDYFENACWTISYDPKNQSWVSFHDWVPTFLLPSKTHFMSVDVDSIWKHNIRCDSYCNFYGVNYPFEIEFVSATGQEVVSMRNIEYLLEVYQMHNDCRDKFHILDENFDQAIIYNSEQISGLLNLELKAKNNPLTLLNYPKININSITINYSKEENKYRFNQFWDVTKNRGEFKDLSIPMFNVEPNGYKYPINSQYVNYEKSALERKKFRHNVNKVFLRKTVSNDKKFIFKISNQKILPSYR